MTTEMTDAVSRPLVMLRGVGLEVAEPVPTRILHPVDLDIESATAVAVVGPSGAGKTTLASLIGALQQPTEGSYRFDGQEVAGMSGARLAEFRARDVGFVFQHSHLIDERSVVANVDLGLVGSELHRVERAELCAAALEWVGLATLGARRSAFLSGGERHRVAIARALVKSPRLILADEPTAALDQETGREILELLANATARGATVILVTHDPRAVEYVDAVHRIVDGRLTGGGHS
ncbi:ABC transporter ATP-binding protein [Nocardioides marmoriginsengisoli]|uniref:ABC transporter ATP-binding protein n=1 Tax=Nocardioides marmoriginsengisoli TaxID=661483 RepID=A0A3N0CB73_9ACTN|nr:ABC transporter ATP-binding protein [Nocardioides marmoriginsengisoli]RNL60705.1 ABC transporter ATP-binding protein [Nocardioides marmoriginsengisoli]